MSDERIDKEIQSYLKQVRRLLPEGFETDDMIDDLETHIYEAYEHKKQTSPRTDNKEILGEVLDDIGTPEEIAEEYGKVESAGTDETESFNDLLKQLIRFIFVGVICILAAYFVSSVVETIDFWTALIALMIFAVIEAVLRNKVLADEPDVPE